VLCDCPNLKGESVAAGVLPPNGFPNMLSCFLGSSCEVGAAPKRGVELPLAGALPNKADAGLSAGFASFSPENMPAGSDGVAPKRGFAGAVDDGAGVPPKLKPTAGVVGASAGLADVPNKLLAGEAAGFASSALAALPNKLLDWKTDAGLDASGSEVAGFIPNNADVDCDVSSAVAGLAPNKGLAAGFDVSPDVAGLAPNNVAAGVAFCGSGVVDFAPASEALAALGVSDSVAAGFAPNTGAAGVVVGLSSPGLAWPKTEVDGFEPNPPKAGVVGPDANGEATVAGAAPNRGDDTGFGCSDASACFSASFACAASLLGVGGSSVIAGAEDGAVGFWAKSEPEAFGAAEPKMALGCDEAGANLMGLSVVQVLLAGAGVVLSFEGLAGLSFSGDAG